MIKKYIPDSLINTDAVVVDINKEDFDFSTSKLDIFNIHKEENKLILEYDMPDDEVVYGLGENIRGINKRGHIYNSFCSDDPCHTEEKSSLYGAHNFIILSGDEHTGLFIDSSSEVTFDIGYTIYNKLKITVRYDNCALYIIHNNSDLEIVKEFRKLIGQSYVAPYWAFGYQQCRWSYATSDAVRCVLKKHKENSIPLDAIYLDIDYMDSFKDFTINKENFGDFDELVADMKKDNIHLVPIIDAGVKIEKGYNIYEEGVANNYFCKDKDGNDFAAAVWPGKTHFPDFFKEDVRVWFGNHYSDLIDRGIDGFWNDMNEPAIFYSENGIKKAFDTLDSYKGKDIGVYDFFGMKDAVLHLSNSREDYSSFYHTIDDKKVCHIDVHNLYGYNMTRAAKEAFDRNYPDKRFLMHSRSSYIGMHRYSGIWTGDNQSWWSHLLLSMKMMPSLNMCGFIYTGSDIGGFGCNSTRDLVLRWLAFGLFTPLMRNHSALGTRDQEAYNFGDTADFKNIIDLRYSLIPHIYSEYMKAVLRDDMYFKPLAFVFDKDRHCREVEDQLMIGDSLMIAPVYTQNVTGRYVYLPEDMLYINYTTNGVKQYKVLTKGHHYIYVKLDEVPMFLRKGHAVSFVKPAANTTKLDTNNLELVAFMDKDSSLTYEFYEDDGISKNYSLDKITNITVNMDAEGKATIGECKKNIKLITRS
ncbi:MAG: alpha-glucosidase [Lachnospiraceae bacterium]|nr:alpha-glucosidase [Lachnospiraceae bacterium]